MGILITLLILLAVVGIHEYGHYLLMRRNGVTVTEFSIGLGPLIWQYRLKSGTWFQLRMIPLGGYAKPVQDGPGSMDGLSGWARYRIFMAGMFMNSLAAFAVLLPLYYATGSVHAIIGPFIAWAPIWAKPIVAAFLMSFGLWFAGPFLLAWLMISHGVGFFTHDVSGPVGILSQGSQIIAATGPTVLPIWVRLAELFAMLNIGLAMFNLVPIMPLDGGRVASDLVTKFMGQKAATLFNTAGTILMLAFFIFIIASDFVKIFS